MNEAVRNHYKPRTLNDLEAAIKHFWKTKMTPDACARYVSHLHAVLPRVVKMNGAAMGL